MYEPIICMSVSGCICMRIFSIGMVTNYPNIETFSFSFLTKNCQNIHVMTNGNLPDWSAVMFNFKCIILLHELATLIELPFLLSIKCMLNIRTDSKIINKCFLFYFNRETKKTTEALQ